MDSAVNIVLSAEDAAQITGLSVRAIRHNSKAGKYSGATKLENGWAIPLTALPDAAQLKYWEAQQPEQASHPNQAPEIDTNALHLAYRHAPKKSKERADNLCHAIIMFETLCSSGESKGRAADIINAECEIAPVTLWRARDTVKGHPRPLWAALLLPRYTGRSKVAEFSGEAWEWIRARYLSTSEPPARVVIKEARKEAKLRGWVLPSYKTILRKINTIPAPITLQGRKGKEAFDASYPAAERDFTAYGLHDVWVSDGRRVDVFCRWPDGTVARPFIVAWCDMRTRMVLGARGGINPTSNLVLASLSAALVSAQIKPARALLDNGREYAAKNLTGGQKTRYRFKMQEDDPIGALTRMGIEVDWARPYRGQEKPIESFWKYIANHLDKLPEFQGAYCGKNTVSKPEDFDQKKAIPLEIFSAKLAEVLEEFNREHHHRGQGMDGRTPLQLYQELIEANPGKEWNRITSEDLRLLCLEQKMLTLNNKDASLRFKLDGFGEMRYWAEMLADLPLSARSKKYNVYFNPDDPDLPVLVYEGDRFICEASRIGLVGDKQTAANHCMDKAEFKKPRAEEFKAIKQASPVALPMPASIHSVLIDKPAAPEKPAEQPKLVQIAPGVWQDPKTGEIIGKVKPENTAPPNNDIEKYKLIQEEREAERLKRFGTT